MINNRKIIKGTVISGGIVMGHARVILPGDVDIAEVPILSSKVYAEVEALDKAVEETVEDLKLLRTSAGKKMGGPVAKIFDAQLLVATDQEFLKKVKTEIASRKRNAGFVYHELVKNNVTPLKNSSDSYMRQMAVDIEAVANRILSHLSGYKKSNSKLSPNTILVGRQFSPGEIMSYRDRKAIGFIVGKGGKSSHMALIARGLMLPTLLIKDALRKIVDNSRIIVDGVNGCVIINPTDEDWIEYQKLKKKHGTAQISRIKRLTDFPPKTADGKIVSVGSNLALPGPVDEILTQQNIPIGLYRSEFLYLSHYDFPDEETQYKFYDGIAETYKNSSVTMRTFDLGYDKLSENSAWPHEDNPALGWRGIRPMLEMTDIFKTQIRAILKASHRKNLKIMLPMISDVTELEKAKKMISQVKFRLKKENIPFDENIQIGIMVEVPSAAMSADSLAKKVDFISIGTNDLTQYTLAADRMNQKVADLFSAFHPAVLKLICQTVKACKKHNKPVSICGEIAGDLLALPMFIGMGVDLLSMNPGRIFDLCRLVKKIDTAAAHLLTESVMSAETKKEVLNLLQDYKQELEKKKQLSKRK